MADEDEELGGLTGALSNPYVSIPYAILNGVLGAVSPGGARLSSGLNAGVGLGMGAERVNREEGKKKRLSTSLDALFDSKKPVTTEKRGIDLNAPDTKISMPDSNMRLSQATLAPRQELPTFNHTENVPMFSPQAAAYGKALVRENPNAAATFAGQLLTKDENRKPTAVRPGGALVDENGKVLYTAPAAPTPQRIVPAGGTVLGADGRPTYTAPQREVTPPRPVFAEQGGKAVQAFFNENTRQWDTTTSDLTAAPARQLALEDKRLKGAQADSEAADAEAARANVQLRKAQTEKAIAEVKNVASNAKAASTGQLGSALNALNQMGDGADNTEKGMIKQAKTVILQELAIRQKTIAAPAPAPAAPPGRAPVGAAVQTLPPAKDNKGAIARDDAGKRVKSDGTKWVEIK